MGIRSILVGVDGRERSYRALAFSAGLAQRESAALSVCYVHPCNPWQSVMLSSLWASQSVFWDIAADDGTGSAIAQQICAEAADALRASGLTGCVLLRSGDIATELARVADEEHADLIVVGSPRHRRRRFAAAARRLTRDVNRGLLVTP